MTAISKRVEHVQSKMLFQLLRVSREPSSVGTVFVAAFPVSRGQHRETYECVCSVRVAVRIAVRDRNVSHV